jgi:hypothetical protein
MQIHQTDPLPEGHACALPISSWCKLEPASHLFLSSPPVLVSAQFPEELKLDKSQSATLVEESWKESKTATLKPR